ncbi:C-type mannose receptor 2-like protein [Labeo rohita]|uniref:C-type mannose receptor 2-like protein n=1 Tax=Labeo rohita TaxID=84645 RepID=A0A498N6B8_LABRO|nr:C-type mannose receptor 2-like protein [Labeo rohita]
MMQNKIQLVILLAGILSMASCVPYKFILIEEPKTWVEAQSYCREKHTALATVQSDEDRAKLKEAANAVNFQSVAWIGFYKVVWHWSYQNTIISYARWDSSEPNLLNTTEVCALVKRNGRWADTYCSEKRFFFCSDSYTLYYKFRYIETSMTWHEAQTYCRTNYIDLATVKDDNENQFLVNKLNMEFDLEAWIGLSKTPGQWLWLDQTSVSSSVKWLSGQPDDASGDEKCAIASTDGELSDDTCSTPLPFYCRESGKIQRVRVAVKSDGYLNESAVMEAIEKKVR